MRCSLAQTASCSKRSGSCPPTLARVPARLTRRPSQTQSDPKCLHTDTESSQSGTSTPSTRPSPISAILIDIADLFAVAPDDHSWDVWRVMRSPGVMSAISVNMYMGWMAFVYAASACYLIVLPQLSFTRAEFFSTLCNLVLAASLDCPVRPTYPSPLHEKASASSYLLERAC